MKLNPASSIFGARAASGAYQRVGAVIERAASERTRGADRTTVRLDGTARKHSTDTRREASTPAAAALAELIHRMGGAASSLARGAYVNLRV